jgi:hypothetical protein
VTATSAWIDDPLTMNLLVGILALYPLFRIFRRAGLAPWPTLLVLIPVVGWPVVGSVLAFRRWPSVAPRNPKKA